MPDRRSIDANVRYHILNELWLASGDADNSNSLRAYKFTAEHFLKNCFNRQRVYLSAQVTSRQSCRLIDDSVQNKTTRYNKDDLAPLREILLATDRFLDIMNAKSKDDADFVNCPRINSPDHSLLTELLDILSLYTEWKMDSGPYKERFITRESYEDLSWIIMSTLGVAVENLETDKSKILAQDKNTSDPCEFHFGNTRMRHGSASVQNCVNATAHAQAVRTHTFSLKGNVNTAGARKETLSELMAPMLRRAARSPSRAARRPRPADVSRTTHMAPSRAAPDVSVFPSAPLASSQFPEFILRMAALEI